MERHEVRINLFSICELAFSFLCFLIWGLLIGCVEKKSISSFWVDDLKCCRLVDPVGVDEPILSWKIRSIEQNVKQVAWEIEVAKSETDLKNGNLVWKSKKESDDQFGIFLDGLTCEEGICYYWRVRVWDQRGNLTDWSRPALFTVGLKNDNWKAHWVTINWEQSKSLPIFRKEFNLSKDLDRAMIYFCGLGCGDLYLNGALVDSTRVLDPAQTNYEQYALYTTFDVTCQLQKGVNCLGVMLGEGWYAQGRVWGGGMKYGDPLFRLQMDLFYKDGTKESILSDPSWKWHDGAIISSNLYAGECYDATCEIQGWSKAGFSDGTWKNSIEATGIIPLKMYPQLVEPIRMKRTIPAIKKWKDPSGRWIYDFGENVAGVPLIKVNQPRGTRLRMRMGEYVKGDGAIEFGTTGVFATGVIQTDEYICAGRKNEVWQPRFTYHGYRYLELSGEVCDVPIDSIQTVVLHSDVETRGSFMCANEQLNHLHEIALRTVLSNTHGLPTDCPHRERCGWLGDAHTVAPFENNNFNMYNFWMKYMEDICSTSSSVEKNALHQKLHNTEFYFTDKLAGTPYMIAPGKRLCGVASPDWGTAIVQIPWYTYLYYGDKEPLKRYYPIMKHWVEHVESITMNDTLSTRHIVPFGLGDWCPPEGNGRIECPIALSSTAFHYWDVAILRNVAEILEKEDDVKRFETLKQDVKKAFISQFYDTKRKTFGCQTADAMALDFGLVPEGDEKFVSDAIVADMNQNHEGFIHTGIFGLGRIGQALSRYGNADMAWSLFTKTGENSFAYMWENANATTLWEVLPINQKSMQSTLESNASLNHPMQGGYDSWFYEEVAGLRPDPAGPGFKIVRMDPSMMGFLSWAKAVILTDYGSTESFWKQEDGKFVWNIILPANTSALVALPKDKKVYVNGRMFNTVEYPLIEQKYGKFYYRFPSGRYNVEIITR